MSDKARKEFEAFASNFGLNTAIDGGLYRSQIVCRMWQAWLAAKEKYEPRWLPMEEDCLRMVLSLVDGGSVKQVTKLIPLIQIETSNCNEVERYADQCWRELNAPITQGEEQ